MYIYKIYQSPTYTFEAVKQGWSWPAFFFGPFWTLCKAIWGLTFVIFIGQSILISTYMNLFLKGLSEQELMIALQPFSFFLTMIVAIPLALYGNRLRERNLLTRGYKHVAYIIAESPQIAIREHMNDKSNNFLLAV